MESESWNCVQVGKIEPNSNILTSMLFTADISVLHLQVAVQNKRQSETGTMLLNGQTELYQLMETILLFRANGQFLWTLVQQR